MAVSKRLRYEVLRRDNFTCRYCGRAAPEFKITADHVIPKALGGKDEPSNLVAACGDCNGGKTSSSPDAPLVAEVAEDALRWSRAMQQAAAAMLANRDGRSADHVKFSEKWDSWTYGADKLPVPKDPHWPQTVDSLRAAGLPLAVLLDCVDLAMGRQKIKADHTFRYMCGIAWNKVKELQEAARLIAGGAELPAGIPEAGPATDPYEQGRLDLARELLDDLTEEERDYYLGQADMSEYQEDGEPPQTETQLACEAISYALNGIRHDWDYLCSRVEVTLKELPDGLGEQVFKTEEDALTIRCGPFGRRTFRLTDALYATDDLLRLPWARTYLDALSEDERAEWLEYAANLNHRANLSPERLLVRAAFCAQVVSEGGYYDAMCGARGKHIKACPNRAAFHVRIPELECCAPDAPEDHKGHPACEHHLERLIEGQFVTPSGKSLTVSDYTDINPELAPF